MNTIKRFFRRNIFSTIRIIALFFAVNLLLLLVGAFFIITYLNGVADSIFPIEDFSNHIIIQNGQLTPDTQAFEILHQTDAWAMILDDDGTVIWEDGLPEELPRKYTVTDIVMFSRWYLEDYPINVWERTDGLLVIGFPPESASNFYVSTNIAYIWPFVIGIGIVFIINFLLMIYLFLRNTHQIEKSMEPILNGIQLLSQGKEFRLEEKGELAEINAGLNRASAYLLKKDNTRAEWIRGISHDIRTPLSMILGYASEIEDTFSLPEATRKQAGIIRRYSEKLKNLVSDLNLTTKLEYSMQPMQRKDLDPVELARQIVSEVLNDGLSELYELELSEDNPGKNILIVGDQTLLNRMLGNLIRNCIIHNPNGCKIQVSIGSNDTMCVFSVMDNGNGISKPQLNALNSDEDISSTRKQIDGAEHGLGLKIVRQIVKAHQGTIQFSSTISHGLFVTIFLPLKL